MTRKKAFQLSTFLVLPLTVSVGLLTLSAVQAQNSSSKNTSGGVVFKPTGAPRTTSGGASRGICPTAIAQVPPSQTAIIPLVPKTDRELTTEAHPTIFVDIPDSVPQQAEFSLWDENQNGIYQTTFSLAGKAGIVSFKLPNSAPPLAVGKRYKWSIAIVCDRTQRNRDLVVEGWMQRTQLDVATTEKLATLEPLQRAQLYAQNSIWYETLETLAELRRSRPEDSSIATEWQNLLQSVGLKDVAQAPLVNCCQSAN